MTRLVFYVPSGRYRSRNFSFDTGLSYYGMPIKSWGDAKTLSKFIKKQETAYNRHPEKFTGEPYERVRLMSDAARYLDQKNNTATYSEILNSMTGAIAPAVSPAAAEAGRPEVPPAVSSQPAVAQADKKPDPVPERPGVSAPGTIPAAVELPKPATQQQVPPQTQPAYYGYPYNNMPGYGGYGQGWY
jgi:hypothetical protein